MAFAFERSRAGLRREVAVMSPLNLGTLVAPNSRRSSVPLGSSTTELGVPQETWIAEIHLAACRRWLACEPAALIEAERTLRLLECAVARMATREHPYSGTTVRVDQEPVDSLQSLRQRVNELAGILATLVTVKTA